MTDRKVIIKKTALHWHFQNIFPKQTLSSNKYFQNNHFVCILIETRIITKFAATKAFSKYFQNPPQTHLKQSNFKSDLASNKSPQITTDEKGANTFPFHNLSPKLKKISQRSFLFFSPFPYWIKEKSVATLANRNICDKTQNPQVSSPTVSQIATSK